MKASILSDLFKSQGIANLLSKTNPEHLRDDLRQELFLALCEKPEKVIVDLHEKGQLQWYTVRVCWNMIASSSSPFHKKFRQYVKEYLEESTIEEVQSNFGRNAHLSESFNEPEEKEQNHSRLVDAVKECMEGMYWYDREMLKNYAEKGSAGKLINSGLNIPKRSILATVKKAKTIILNDPNVKEARA